MKKRPRRGRFSGLRFDRDGLHAKITELRTDEDLHPYILSAVGLSASAVGAAAFREMADPPVV